MFFFLYCHLADYSAIDFSILIMIKFHKSLWFLWYMMLFLTMTQFNNTFNENCRSFWGSSNEKKWCENCQAFCFVKKCFVHFINHFVYKCLLLFKSSGSLIKLNMCQSVLLENISSINIFLLIYFLRRTYIQHCRNCWRQDWIEM